MKMTDPLVDPMPSNFQSMSSGEGCIPSFSLLSLPHSDYRKFKLLNGVGGEHGEKDFT